MVTLFLEGPIVAYLLGWQKDLTPLDQALNTVMAALLSAEFLAGIAAINGVMKSQVDEVARELETAGQAATRLKNDLDRLRDERDAWRRAATEAREAESQASARLRAHRDELVELGKGLNAEANRAETIVALERDLASCRGDLRSARAALAEQEAVAWKRKKEEASRASADERVRQLTTAWERKTEEVAAASRASADERVRQLTDELAAQRIEHKKLQVAMEKLHSKHAQLTRKASDDEAHRKKEIDKCSRRADR